MLMPISLHPLLFRAALLFFPSYRLSVHAVILDESNRVLQLKATYGSRGWGLPGGNIDRGETIHEALLRECREELGCDVAIQALTGVYYHARYNSQVFIFRCSLPAGQRIRLSREHSEHRYFALGELSEVQRRRVQDCIEFDGKVRSAAFPSARIKRSAK